MIHSRLCVWFLLVVFGFIRSSVGLTEDPPQGKQQNVWQALFDGRTLAGWKKTNFGGEGEINVENSQIIMEIGQSLTGLTYTQPFVKKDYELELEAKRVAGSDFFCGLTFPVADSHCSFILGGWGGSLVGLSSIDGLDASENETMQVMALKDNQWYRIRVRVTDEKIQVWLDDKSIIAVTLQGRKISTRLEVDLSKPLGFSAWETRAAIRNIRFRKLKPAVPDPEPPQVAPASDEPKLAMQQIKLADGLSVSLYAAEPQVANVVAFDVDDQGRVFVCETFRQKRGIEDNRSHMDWLDDDLAAKTVADRLAYLKKHLGESLIEYSTQDDRIRVLQDIDHDGIADRSTVFADHFNGPLEGTGAGVLALPDGVFYTCIPSLWKLKDSDDDGRADIRTKAFYGFGVRYAFRGHDLHGLIQGPDGRIYFSVGDRGYHIEQDGQTFSNPESGAVFRCELDGTNLEVIATGLRNPQELAFDDYGNLFTGDNNSDSGDRARLVYILPGSDSGWRMAYQYLDDRGPFNREKIWHPHHQGQPAYIVPPVANFADGPSGFTYYPGTGWGKSYRGTFFLCDFRGTPSQSGIRTFRVTPNGAFFNLEDTGKPIWHTLATDAKFGPDGALYVSDWVNGWEGEGKGRIYRITHHGNHPAIRQVQQMLNNGMDRLSLIQLAELLNHDDQRIRLRAQWNIAKRDADQSLPVLIAAAASGRTLFARLHGLWGWGQVIRRAGAGDSLKSAIPLLQDPEPQVRAHTAALLGNAHHAPAWQQLIHCLKDENRRVQMYASFALAKIPRPDVVTPLLKVLKDNNDQDPALRHAVVMALASLGNPTRLLDQFDDAGQDLQKSKSVRIGVVVALRRLRASEITRFLHDPDRQVVEEAARAIHDLPISGALPALADLLAVNGIQQSDNLLRRAMNANLRLGSSAAALRLANFAADTNRPQSLRLAALSLLAQWESPSSRDWVLGMWRPLKSRSSEPAGDAVRSVLPQLLANSTSLKWQAIRTAALLGLKEVIEPLEAVVHDRETDGQTRADSLDLLAGLAPAQVTNSLPVLMNDPNAIVRIAALKRLAATSEQRAMPMLKRMVESGTSPERKASFELLGSIESPSAVQLLIQSLQALKENQIPQECQVELIEASKRHQSPVVKQALDEFYQDLPKDDPIARYRPALHGGQAARGRELFRNRLELSCRRCHAVDGDGGSIGPDLGKIGTEKDQVYLLESIVAPNKAIAKGYESIVIQDADGVIHNGVRKHEDDQIIRLVTAQGVTVTIKKSDIEAQSEGKSAMPEDVLKHLDLRDIRDLVAYLQSLKGK